MGLDDFFLSGSRMDADPLLISFDFKLDVDEFFMTFQFPVFFRFRAWGLYRHLAAKNVIFAILFFRKGKIFHRLEAKQKK